MILFTTQLVVFEMLVRNVVDAMRASRATAGPLPLSRRRSKTDARRALSP